ncbi:MAG: hypothetical protein EAZ89_21745 [Bacteroidetes bacterium]|nr:MAG: hypothetical protein EAZ89_21745 [Bacteroidota bacterium]
MQGDARVAEQLRAFLMEELPAHPGFFKRLAIQALENEPPLSFLKNFVVERSGKHKDQFDIQLRGIAPLTDAVRVLALHAGIGETSTFLRLEQLAAHDPVQQQLYEEAADTLTLLLRHRLKYALEEGGSGRYLNPDQLNRIERQTLKYAFRTIGELQELIKNRFT